MSLEDIEKLRVRVEKDPQSRLFLPLAEEYRKTGMLNEAISVLLNGLERHPAYTSARVTLGKIYLEMSRVHEARDEFEQVVSSVPDNLFAHRKLADIYREEGDQGKAVREYRRVLQLNPLDEEARAFLEQLEGKGSPAEPALPAFHEVKAAPAEVRDILTMDLEDLPATSEDAIPVESGGTIDDTPVQAFNEFTSFFSNAGGQSYEKMFEVPGEAPTPDALDEIVEPAIVSAASDDIPVPSVDLPDAEEPALSFTESEDLDRLEVVEELDEPEVLGEDEKDALNGLGGIETEESFHENTDDVSLLSGELEEAYHADVTVQELEADLAYADTFVVQGEYAKAMKIFQECLAKNPGNRHILQRISELKDFLRIIGKGEEVVIARLETFLAGIYRRKDEFFRSS